MFAIDAYIIFQHNRGTTSRWDYMRVPGNIVYQVPLSTQATQSNWIYLYRRKLIKIEKLKIKLDERI